MEIYKDNKPISRSIDLYLESDKLILLSYDSCKGFSEERIITVKDIDSLKKAMNVESDDDLFNKIKADYSKADAVDQFVNFLTDHEVQYIYHRFTN